MITLWGVIEGCQSRIWLPRSPGSTPVPLNYSGAYQCLIVEEEQSTGSVVDLVANYVYSRACKTMIDVTVQRTV